MIILFSAKSFVNTYKLKQKTNRQGKEKARERQKRKTQMY